MTAKRARMESLDELIEGRGLRSVFQPIVNLDTREVLGYEALTRGPAGHPLESPADLFGAAERAGRTRELDRACRRLALDTAVLGGMTKPLALFVNVEAETAHAARVGAASADLARTVERLTVIFEVTERALTDNTEDLLEAVTTVREIGCGIALDDVGADQRSLPLMALLEPDVIKLDLSLVQQQPSQEIAQIAGAVRAQADGTGASVLAEGIEREEHVLTARELGATLAQGFLFGRPEPLPQALRGPSPSRAIRIDTGRRPRQR